MPILAIVGRLKGSGLKIDGGDAVHSLELPFPTRLSTLLRRVDGLLYTFLVRSLVHHSHCELPPSLC